MSFNWGLIADNLPLLLQGALVTVEITAMSVGCGFFIGLLVSLANLSKFSLVRLLAKCYVDIIRGTPLLVQIFLIYFALPMITGQRIGSVYCSCYCNVVLTLVHMCLKFSVLVFSLLIKVKWRLVDLLV